jgi:hypothetical protein
MTARSTMEFAVLPFTDILAFPAEAERMARHISTYRAARRMALRLLAADRAAICMPCKRAQSHRQYLANLRAARRLVPAA